MNDALLTMKEVAARLRVSTRTVQRLAKAERLPSPLRIGGSPRWCESAIEQWIEAGCPGRSAKVGEASE